MIDNAGGVICEAMLVWGQLLGSLGKFYLGPAYLSFD